MQGEARRVDYEAWSAGPIPEGARPWLGALLLAYYDPEGRLVYAGRAGAGITQVELWRRLQPLAVSEMPLAVPPRRDNRFGSPLVLGRVHWMRPELVAEVKYLTWTGDDLLRQVSTKACARTSQRPRCAGLCRIRCRQVERIYEDSSEIRRRRRSSLAVRLTAPPCRRRPVGHIFSVTAFHSELSTSDNRSHGIGRAP
jgi:ATP-dependent DNA ligase